MGLVQSGAAPRSDNDVPRGIYPRYKWTREQFAANIQRGVLTPCFQPLKEPGRTTHAYCELCYHGFDLINEMQCCGHAACTECLAAYILPENFGNRICPFCRKQNFTIIPNRCRRDLNRPFDGGGTAEEPVILDWDDKLPEEVNLIFLEYSPSPEQREMVIEMYNAGISAQDIIASLV